MLNISLFYEMVDYNQGLPKYVLVMVRFGGRFGKNCPSAFLKILQL